MARGLLLCLLERAVFLRPCPGSLASGSELWGLYRAHLLPLLGGAEGAGEEFAEDRTDREPLQAALCALGARHCAHTQ